MTHCTWRKGQGAKGKKCIALAKWMVTHDGQRTAWVCDAHAMAAVRDANGEPVAIREARPGAVLPVRLFAEALPMFKALKKIRTVAEEGAAIRTPDRQRMMDLALIADYARETVRHAEGET